MRQICSPGRAAAWLFVGILALGGCDGESSATGGTGGAGGEGGNGGGAPLDCGDGDIDAGEECDGEDLDDQDCYSLGFNPGILSCNDDCTRDTSLCGAAAACGDDQASLGELCDGSDLNGASCVTQGFNSGSLVCTTACDAFDTSGCVGGSACGDGVTMPPERCDGADVGAFSCAFLGFFGGGDLGCLPDCSNFDVSACVPPGPTCGDNAAIGIEVCDGTDLKLRTCISFGFDDGDLACTPDCGGFDTSGCNGTGPVCGNGTIEGYEDCDGVELDGATCASEDFTAGTLACAADCTFDFSACTTSSVCGDGEITHLEECDGEDLNGHSCETVGWVDGPLRCNAGCRFDTSGCIGCGDGLVSSFEDCEGTDLAGGSCQSQGFPDGGTISCNDDCTFNYDLCLGEPTCGDGIVAGSETCDGTNIAGADCVALGFSGGGVTCTDCQLELGACTGALAGCGDGVAALHFCDGDDFQADCAGLGIGDGEMGCYDDCTPDVTNCGAGTDICQALGWYNDGVCDPCIALGGGVDGDCAAVCGAEGNCGQWYLGAIASCPLSGFPTDPDCGICGNLVLEPGELCDGDEFADRADDGTPDTLCEDWGNYTDGPVTCGPNCVPIFSACVP